MGLETDRGPTLSEVSETLASALDSKLDLVCGYQEGYCPSQWVAEDLNLERSRGQSWAPWARSREVKQTENTNCQGQVLQGQHSPCLQVLPQP